MQSEPHSLQGNRATIGDVIRRSLLSVVLLSTLFAAGSGKPDFSGAWEMVAEKSEFTGAAKPLSLVRTIEHKEPKIRIHTAMSSPKGDVITDVRYTTDGAAVTNTIRGAQVPGSMKWAGESLELAYTRALEGGKVTSRERWTLSPDGRTMTAAGVIEQRADPGSALPSGDIKFTMLLEKK